MTDYPPCPRCKGFQTQEHILGETGYYLVIKCINCARYDGAGWASNPVPHERSKYYAGT